MAVDWEVSTIVNEKKKHISSLYFNEFESYQHVARNDE